MLAYGRKLSQIVAKYTVAPKKQHVRYEPYVHNHIDYGLPVSCFIAFLQALLHKPYLQDLL